MNVGNRLLKLAFFPHETVPIFAVPEGMGRHTPMGSQMLVDPARGKFLPRGDDLAHRPSIHGLNQDVNVIWHDHPSEKPVTQRVEI